MAQPFDAETRRSAGERFRSPNRSPRRRPLRRFFVFPRGVLAYAPGWRRCQELRGSIGPARSRRSAAGAYQPRLSPDERRVAVAGRPAIPQRDIWIIDVARNVRARLTFDPGGEGVASAGRRTARGWPSSAAIGAGSFLPARARGRAGEELVARGPTRESHRPSPRPVGPRMDGSSRTAARVPFRPPQISGWCRVRRSDAVCNRAIPTFLEESGSFSPDGQWIAYATAEAASPTSTSSRFRRQGGKYQVSKDGGSTPAQWRSDGKELFFVGPDRALMAVATGADRPVRLPARRSPSFQTVARRLQTPNSQQQQLYADERWPTVSEPSNRSAQSGGVAADRGRQLGGRTAEDSDGVDLRHPPRPYEIVAPLGAGGMGEVYRARDTKLNRDVAIKVLPDAFARMPTAWRGSSAKRRCSRRSIIRTSRRSTASKSRWRPRARDGTGRGRRPVAADRARRRSRSTRRCRSRGRSPRRSRPRTSRASSTAT